MEWVAAGTSDEGVSYCEIYSAADPFSHFTAADSAGCCPKVITARQGVAFLAAWIIASIVIGMIAKLLHVVEKLPVVSTLNKAGGAVLGLVLGVAVLWILLLLIGAFQDNGWCGQIADMVKKSSWLMKLNDSNPLAQLIKGYGFPSL